MAIVRENLPTVQVQAALNTNQFPLKMCYIPPCAQCKARVKQR